MSTNSGNNLTYSSGSIYIYPYQPYQTYWNTITYITGSIYIYPYQPYQTYWNTITYITGDTVKNWNYLVTDKEYTFTLDLPGHEKVRVEKKGQETLVLEGLRNGVRTYREFILQSDADFANGTANFKDGVLTVVMPRQKVEPQTIEVTFG